MSLLNKYKHKKSIGEEIRFSHNECNDSRNRLYVKRTKNGWLYHCFNCGFTGFDNSNNQMSPIETLNEFNKLKENQIVNKKEIKLPDDFTTVIPNKGLAWLFKYGITEKEIQQYGFGYSKNYNRLIMPIYNKQPVYYCGKSEKNTQNLIYWQGRNLGKITKQNPKYINIRNGSVQNVVFKILFSIDNNCIIVEDILSTIKVGRITNAIGLLGSYISDSMIPELNGRYKQIFIWLDYDKQKESIMYSKKISSLLGIKVIPIITELDPKCYTTKQIKEILR